MLDLVLEALEAVPSRVANRALVSLFNPTFIPHMIGFKFSLYSGRGGATPPPSLDAKGNGVARGYERFR